MTPAPGSAGFARLVTALAPRLDQIVFIGGWAHRMHRLDPRAQATDFEPLMTLDADIAVPHGLPERDRSLRDLLAASGFREEFHGDDRPPATHYRLGGEEGGFYAEFLTPLAGAALTRDGRRKATAQVAGVTSQQLRYLELLLQHPWTVEVSPGAFDVPGPMRIQIANPASFMAQKLLIHKWRDRGNRAKDILYTHDTLQVFGAKLEELRDEWTNGLLPLLHPKAARAVVTASNRLFGELSDPVREAAAMAGGRRLSAEALGESCHYGLGQVFQTAGKPQPRWA